MQDRGFLPPFTSTRNNGARMGTQRSIIAVLTLLALGLSSTAALSDTFGHPGHVEIQVIDDRGREFRQYDVPGRPERSGTERAYVEAKQGERYSIRVRNRSQHRIGVVIAVDGRNIISGDQSHLTKDERMYVLRPGEKGTYEGWRTAKDRVNRFFFTDAEDSYAEAFGDRTAMGVIAAAVYREVKVIAYRDEGAMARELAPPPGAAPAPGTGFGEGKSSPSNSVSFEPEDQPWQKVFLKYEWRETLCQKGIARCRSESQNNRFWDEPEDGNYAPYPPGSRR
jgi:hypothetical protein